MELAHAPPEALFQVTMADQEWTFKWLGDRTSSLTYCCINTPAVGRAGLGLVTASWLGQIGMPDRYAG